MDTLASTGTDMLIQHGLPWLGKKAVEMGRYYGSEATPFVQKTGSEMFDKLSTKVRPKRRYKTDRKELDGGNLNTILEQLGTPGKVASKSMDVVGTLIPSTNEVFDRYKS